MWQFIIKLYFQVMYLFFILLPPPQKKKIEDLTIDMYNNHA
jgi:hypothetical protein